MTYADLQALCKRRNLRLCLWDFLADEEGGWILTVQRRGRRAEHSDVDIASRPFRSLGELDVIAAEMFAAMRVTLDRQQP